MKENTVDAEIIEDTQIVLSEIKYPVSTTDLKALLEEYINIPDINPDADEDLVGEQYQFVLKGHKAFVKARTGIEKTRKTLKQPALDYGKTVDGIAKEFQSIIKSTEDKLQIQRKRVEDNEGRKQAEAEMKEQVRLDVIKSKLGDFESYPLTFISQSSERIQLFIDNDLPLPTVEAFEEFFDEAINKHKICFNQLQEMRDNKVLVENAQKIQDEADAKARKQQEIEDKKLQAEKDLLAEQQADFQRQKDDFERQQREQQEAIDRQNAEIRANELQNTQEAEKKEADRLAEIERVERVAFEKKELARKKREDKAHREAKIAETIEAMNKYTDNALMLNEIIAGAIPNIKWEL